MTNAVMFVRGVEDSLAEKGFKTKTLLCEHREMRHKLPVHVARHWTINRRYIISVNNNKN